jgi:hypothetical protein
LRILAEADDAAAQPGTIGALERRELDGRLSFGELIAQHLNDSRRGEDTQLPLTDLLRQSVYSRIAGYEDVDEPCGSAVLRPARDSGTMDQRG